MAAIRHGKVTSVLQYRNVSGIHERPLWSVERSYSESDTDLDLRPITSSSSAASTKLEAVQEHTKTGALERCFITKQTGYHLKKFHWVNTLRKDKELENNVVRTLTGSMICLSDWGIMPQNTLVSRKLILYKFYRFIELNRSAEIRIERPVL